MYIHGGRRHDHVILDDLWALDLAAMRWTCMMTHIHGSPPPPLFSHTLTAVDKEMLLLLGGCPEQETGGCLPDSHMMPIIFSSDRLAQQLLALGQYLSIQEQHVRCYAL